MDSGRQNYKTAGRWAFAEFTDVWEMQTDFEAKVVSKFDEMIAEAAEMKFLTANERE